MPGLNCLECNESLNLEEAARQGKLEVYGPGGSGQQFSIHLRCKECGVYNFLSCEGHVYDTYTE